MPWAPPEQPTPLQVESSDASDSDEELDVPPPQFKLDARAILPSATQRTIFAAWDRSRGIGGGGGSKAGEYDGGSARVQAALGFMFDDINEDALAPRPAVAAPPPALKPNHAPLFQAATPSPPPSPRGNTIDLISSDDEPLAPRRLDKGKGRADQNAPEVIEISSDESDGEVVERRLIPRSRPRLPSVSPPLRTAPVNEDTALASVLVVFPDALPSYVLDLLRHPSHRGNPDSVVEILLSGTYPKVVKKRKREEDDDDDIEVIPEVDWLDVKKRKAVDVHYKVAAIEQLGADFDLVQSTVIKTQFRANGLFYAPTYLALRTMVRSNEFECLSKARQEKKRKGDEVETFSNELEREKVWLKNRLIKERTETKRARMEKKREATDKEKGLLISCGCCFGEFIFDVLVQCTEGHLFCKECALANGSTQIGLRRHTLPCMDEDGCEALFNESEALKFLPPASIALLHKVRQEKEIEEAALEGLENCPFCPYACVIENPQERLFRCERAGCRKVSCRTCQKLDHLPATCAEAKDDEKIGAIHKVEEALTAALLRKCPKCSFGFVKSDGCNFMTCSNCLTKSCYLCHAIIRDHSHFDDRGRSGRCILFDDTELRNFNEVEAARLAAVAIAQASNPTIGEKDIASLAAIAPIRRPKRSTAFHAPVGRLEVDEVQQQRMDDYDFVRLELGENAAQAFWERTRGGGGRAVVLAPARAGPAPRVQGPVRDPVRDYQAARDAVLRAAEERERVAREEKREEGREREREREARRTRGKGL